MFCQRAKHVARSASEMPNELKILDLEADELKAAWKVRPVNCFHQGGSLASKNSSGRPHVPVRLL